MFVKEQFYIGVKGTSLDDSEAKLNALSEAMKVFE